jgi:hypothetical protein
MSKAPARTVYRRRRAAMRRATSSDCVTRLGTASGSAMSACTHAREDELVRVTTGDQTSTLLPRSTGSGSVALDEFRGAAADTFAPFA